VMGVTAQGACILALPRRSAYPWCRRRCGDRSARIVPGLEAVDCFIRELADPPHHSR
jgi:hypothetical protein